MGLWKRLRRRLKRKRKKSSAKKQRGFNRRRKLNKLKRRRKSVSRLFKKKKSSVKKKSPAVTKRTRKIQNPKKALRKFKRPKLRIKTRKKLTPEQRRKALEFRNKKRVRTFRMKDKAESAKSLQDQRVEEAKDSVRRKQGLEPKESSTAPINLEELIFELKDSLEKQYKTHGRAAPSYSGTIVDMVSPTEVQTDLPMDKEQLDTGFLWRNFSINYPVNQSVEISGTELEEKDLIIGEQEFDIEQKVEKLNLITKRSEELVSRVIQFFALNGFLTGSLDATALLSQDQEKTIKNVSDELTKAQDKFTITAQHSASLAAIHKNPTGCQPPGSLVDAPPVIPVFEFYNQYTDDYHYSTDFEWRLSQDSARGWCYRTILKGGWHYKEGAVFTNQFEDIIQGKGGGLGGELKVLDASPLDMTAIQGHSGWEGRMAINYGGDSGEMITHCFEWYWQPRIDGEYVFRCAFDDVGFLDIQGRGGEWRRIVDRRYSGWSAENSTVKGTVDPIKVSANDIKTGRKFGMRMMVSEYKGAHAFDIQVKNNTKDVEYEVTIPITKKKWRKKWWKGRKTVVIGYRTEKRKGKSWLHMMASDIHLTDPTSYRRAGTAFGAYDPMIAEHKDAKQHVKIKKYSSWNMQNAEPFKLAGRKTKDADSGQASRAGESVGSHYIGEKPPSNHRVKKDLWGDLGTDFAALKANLPYAHPEYEDKRIITNSSGDEEEIIVEIGKTLPVHRFYNKDKGTYRFKILPDGRTRQARTPAGILKVNDDGIPIMEKLPNLVGTENTLDLAGGDNAASFEKDFTDNTSKHLPASVVGEGFEWQGIAFYAFEPPGIPPNVLPEVQINIKKKAAPHNYQVHAKWGKLDHQVVLEAKAADKDGRITKYTWKLIKQESDIRSVKASKGKVLARDAILKYNFPLGLTTVEVEVEDNRGGVSSDKIDVIVLAPKKSSWKSMTKAEMRELAGGDVNVSYRYHRRRRWRRDVRKTVNVDYGNQMYDYYQLGFKDAMNNDDRRNSSELDRYKFPRWKWEEYRVKVGRKKKFKLWRGRRWVDIYETRKRKKHYTESGKYLSSHKWLLERSGHVRNIHKSEGDIDKTMLKYYNKGFDHARKGPHYLVENDIPVTIDASKYKRRRKSKSSRLRPPKKVRKRIRKALTVPKNVRNKLRPPKKVRQRIKKAGKKIRKFFKRWSDERLKRNINYVYSTKSGLNVYDYNYIWDKDTKYRGVVAQELLETHPSAVGKRFGYYTVDYDKLDVNFERVNG